MSLANPEYYTASQAAAAIREGLLSSELLVNACLGRIRAVDGEVQAWAHLDDSLALAQARARDSDRAEGRACGPLHGVPVALKDVIDTMDYPTEDGTVLHAGRTPNRDATAVSLLRAAGAVIIGKTVTTELATFAPGKTRNPHNTAHTPGGSSSGSAAAVAAFMAPLAVGTQTNGSVIRPAAFCGVYGYKPSRGLFPRHGVLKTSETLDCLGVFARNLEDIGLIASVMVGYDERDTQTRPRASIPYLGMMRQEPPLPPRFALVKTPFWNRADAETHEAFAELAQSLGAQCETYTLPDSVTEAWEWHKTIMEAEMAVHLQAQWDKARDQLSVSLQGQLSRGLQIKAADYLKAKARIGQLNDGFADLFANFDAIISPSAPGAAPLGHESTGDPVFCTLWTLCGMPTLNLPLMTATNGLPLGVQVVGRCDSDARLMQTAHWLVNHLNPSH